VSEEWQFSLAELTEAADVSVRTVRYYIQEGLLPPPVTAGPRTHYTQGHLDRLRLITRMKDAYLPLREIRRRLAGISDAEVAALLAGTETEEERDAAPSHDVFDAPSAPAPPEPARSYAAPPPSDDAASYIARVLGRAPRSSAGSHRLRPVPSPTDEDASWRRIAVGEEAELLITDAAYRRNREKIDWLVDWARKVLG
jgi:DNA-binding transcriptional MerR regulator